MWWPRVISNEELWKENIKFKWIGHTLQKKNENPVKQLKCGTHKAPEREEGKAGREAH
jgi:hypothetical protein